jgi:hypothetical protein
MGMEASFFRPPFILPSALPLGIRADRELLDASLADVKASAPPAAVDRQLIAWSGIAGRSVPEFQGDAMPISSSAVVVKDLTAFGISTWKNQLISRHPDRRSRSITIVLGVIRLSLSFNALIRPK